MKTSIRILAAAVVALAACDRAITADEQQLVGTWRGDQHYSNAAGGGPTDAYPQLTFGRGGEYVAEYFSYGGYGRPANVLTSYNRQQGEYRLQGNVLQVRILLERSQDAVYSEANYIREGDGKWLDAGTVEISGDRLVHHYLTAPLDVPEPTTTTYTRVQG
ncbi:MAG TPA: hypothetical protein VF771_07735 [Longimicrobiaceae bacterium]